MKEKTRRSAELNEIKNLKKHKTQLNKKLGEEIQNWMKQKSRTGNIELNEIKKWKKKYRTHFNKKLEEVVQNSSK